MFGEYQLHRHTTQTTWGREKKTQFGTCVRVCTSTHLLELHCTCTRRHFLSFLTNANARDNNAWRPGERTSSRQSVDPVIGLRLVFLTATLGKEKKNNNTRGERASLEETPRSQNRRSRRGPTTTRVAL